MKSKPKKTATRRSQPTLLGLQPLEPQTARVVMIPGQNGTPVGCGCLVSDRAILTCRHVIEAAQNTKLIKVGSTVDVVLVGVTSQPKVSVTVEALGSNRRTHGFAEDMALLSVSDLDSAKLSIRPIEFATPLVHSGKGFAVMGFPISRPHGLHAEGRLHAADCTGLVQMVGSEVIGVAPGFSGSPVWCPDLKAFVGIVVAGEDGHGLAWCIPSRLLCRFYPGLLVRFRIPPSDRPTINDWDEDDPNPMIFGDVSDNGSRRLTAWMEPGDLKTTHIEYTCLPGSPKPRGGFVTFITYPDFKSDAEDAYELFAQLDDKGTAYQSIIPEDCFTLAAVGDAGDTALTVDLCNLPSSSPERIRSTRREKKD